MRRLFPAVTTAVLAVALWASLAVSPFAVAGVLFVLVVVLASGWPTLLGLPTPRGSTTVLAICGAVAVLVVLLSSTAGVPALRWSAPVLACSIVVIFMHQLFRRDLRPRLVESVTGVVAGVVVVECAVGWLAVSTLIPRLAGVACVTMLGAAVALAVPLSRRWSGVLTLLLSVGAALAAAGLLSGVSVLSATVTGLGVAAVFVGVRRLFIALPSATSRQAAVAAAATGVSASGIVVFMLALVGR